MPIPPLPACPGSLAFGVLLAGGGHPVHLAAGCLVAGLGVFTVGYQVWDALRPRGQDDGGR